MSTIYDLIVSPMFTEKAMNLSEKGNKYTFLVSKYATKSSLKKAIESIFSVQVTKINVRNLPGKIKKFKGTVGQRASRKVSIITLASGHKIDYNNIVGR